MPILLLTSLLLVLFAACAHVFGTDAQPAPTDLEADSVPQTSEHDNSAKADEKPVAAEGAWHSVDESLPGSEQTPRDDGQSIRIWSAQNTGLRDEIRRTLAYYFYRPETTVRRSPWEVMHAVIGFGVDTQVLVDGRQVNAISWLCANGPCYNMRLLDMGNGQLVIRMGAGYQGHAGQLLTALAQSRVKSNYPLIVAGQRMTIGDLVEQEQSTCRSGTELTFKLIALAYYLDSDASWKNLEGEAWDLPRMIKEEIGQPVVGAACGGTHRLTGLSYAVRKRESDGLPVNGEWQRAKTYLDAYHEHTFRFQNRDGSFSTSWFANPGDWGDIHRKLNTTGHTLEWLVFSLPRDQLTDPRVVRAVRFLNQLLWQYRTASWGVGPLGHALHALALYDERLFDGVAGKRSEQLASLRDRDAG